MEQNQEVTKSEEIKADDNVVVSGATVDYLDGLDNALIIEQKRSSEMNVQADENEIDEACQQPDDAGQSPLDAVDSDFENDIQEKQKALTDMFLGDDDNLSQDNDLPKTLVYITGFGKFGNILENPTTHLINHLKRKMEDDDDDIHKQLEISKQQIYPIILSLTTEALERLCGGISVQDQLEIKNLFVVDVTIQHCDEALESIQDKILEDIKEKCQDSNFNQQHQYFILHLGVAASRANFCLENCAKNIMDFRIPDEGNNQPKNEPICKDFDTAQCLFTELDIDKINDQIVNKNKVQISKSENAGEFICNYIFYRSLEKSNKINKVISNLTQEKQFIFGKCTSLFLHVPTFETVPEPIQQDFLECALKSIAENF